jgi:hypothetical protein
MAENMGKWPSGHGQLTKIRLSDGCGGKTITTAAQFEYDRHGSEGYLGNVGLLFGDFPARILGRGGLNMLSLWNAARDTYRRIFGSRPLGADEVFDKLGRVDLGSSVIDEGCLADLPGKTIDELASELKCFIALLVVNRPAEYVLSDPMKSVWQCLVRRHELYTKLQDSLLGSGHSFAVQPMAPGGPVDVSTAYKDFHKAYMEQFGTPDPKIWPRVFRHGKGLEGEVLLVSTIRDRTQSSSGTPASHDVRKTAGLGQEGQSGFG